MHNVYPSLHHAHVLFSNYVSRNQNSLSGAWISPDLTDLNSQSKLSYRTGHDLSIE